MQLWTTYTLLTEIEATFRSLKTDLVLRPVYHHKEDRVTGHLFITLLAYHLVDTLRYQLKQRGIHLSWDSIRNIMSTQQRITITLSTEDNKTIHLRTTTKPEKRQKQIYAALSIKPDRKFILVSPFLICTASPATSGITTSSTAAMEQSGIAARV